MRARQAGVDGECLPHEAASDYPRRTMKTFTKPARSAMTSAILAACTVVPAAAQSSGPMTPSASGTSPLLGYIIAAVLGVLLVVITMIPSKRHTEDL